MLTEFVLGAVQVVVREITTVNMLQLLLALPADALVVAVTSTRNHGAITAAK